MKRVAACFLVSLLLLSGCANKAEGPPEITVKAGSAVIPSTVGVNKWNGGVVDREDSFIALMKNKALEDLPYIKIGETFSIEIKGNSPDSAVLKDYVLNANGGKKFSEETIAEIPVEFKNEKSEFVLEKNMASMLSSNSEDYKPGNSIRGFSLTCTWGNNECEYAFIIRSDAAITAVEE
jgi:hypothetical protein